MGTIKQINIKNRTYYFFNDIINLKNFESNLLKIDKKSYKNIGIYNMDILQLKKLVIVKILIAWILYIYISPMQEDILKK